jgi:general stress protein 26
MARHRGGMRRVANKSEYETIWDHVQSIRTCMMVTLDGGDVRARPMRGIPRPDENLIWFFADRESEAVEGLQSDARACLTYVDSKDKVFVSLSGRISTVFDQEQIVSLWNEEAGSYFSNGPDDPRIMLLRFRPHTGEFWTSPSSAIVIAIKFIEAAITGDRPDLGESGKARLS